MKAFVRELRRRRVFTTAGLYIVGAWLVMQAADVFFPGWGIPDAGINVLLIAAAVGFPLALVFGWFFNITTHGIRRTMPVGPESRGEPRPLKGNDYFVLATLVLVAGAIISYATVEILALPRIDENDVDDRVDLPLPEKLTNSIAVLPFDNIGTDPEDQVFAEGVSEEIRNRLGRHAELQVIARASSLQFRTGDYGAPRISDLLGVQYLLLGSVRRHGQRIRVSAELVLDKGTQLWSENYDRVLEDVFGIQDEIADLVAAEVAPQIVADPEGSYRPSLEAYKHFLAGRDLLYRRDRVGARRELELAIELDPGYAEAHAEYAISLLIGYPDEQDLRKADAAITTALRHALDLPRALAARGLYFSSQSPPDLAASEAALRGALEGDPNMVDAMNWMAGTLAHQGKYEEADEWMERAYALDPFNGSVAANTARRMWEEGNPDRAESIIRRLTELPEPPFMAYFFLTDFYSINGRLVDANRIAKRYLLAGGWMNYFLAYNYAMLGELQTAVDLMAATVRDYPEEMWVRSGWIQAQVPYWKGNYGQAAEEMRRAMSSNGLSLNQVDPELRFFYGINQSLAGDSAGAMETLSQELPDTVDPNIFGGYYGADAYQALAWAYVQSGATDQSERPLEIVEQWYAEHSASVVMMKSEDLYAAARNAAQSGDHDLAMDRLERAVAAGWRGYFINNHDPRWDSLRDNPRYQALIAEVKADVARQRAVVEQIDAEEDFPALLERSQAERGQSRH